MKIISIYNNKGGAGKSTITMMLADFFSSLSTVSGKQARVLVIDFDSQASSATALIGEKQIAKNRKNNLSLTDLLLKVKANKKVNIEDYISKRGISHKKSKNTRLAELSIMHTERVKTIELENSCSDKCSIKLAKALRKLLSPHYEAVFVDLPANIDQRNKLSQIGLLISDGVLVPTEPNVMSISPLVDTFSFISSIDKIISKKRQYNQVVGILFNKTDKRTKQFKLYNKEIEKLAAENNTIVFKNFIPNSPTLANAADQNQSFNTLKDRYASYYEKVRKVAIELYNRAF